MRYIDFSPSQFEGLPVVDVYGIVSARDRMSGPHHTTVPQEPTDIYYYYFGFAAWRIGNQSIQTQRLYFRLVAPQAKIRDYVQRDLGANKIVHIKARILQNANGDYAGQFEEWVGPFVDDPRLNELQEQLRQPVFYNAPGLPQLRAEETTWVCNLDINFWHGFTTRAIEDWQGFGTQLNLESPTRIEVSITTPEQHPATLENLNPPPSPAQLAALRYLMENEEAVWNAVVNHIYESYPTWNSYYGDEYMPPIDDINALRDMIQLKSLEIPVNERDGVAYVACYFRCSWDPEHGFGIALHQSHVIEMTSSDAPSYIIDQEHLKYLVAWLENPPTTALMPTATAALAENVQAFREHFEGTPIVNVHAVISHRGKSASFEHLGIDLHTHTLSFEVWRIINGPEEPTLMTLRFLGTREELKPLTAFIEQIVPGDIVHFKAHVVTSYDVFHALGVDWVGIVNDDLRADELRQRWSPPAV